MIKNKIKIFFMVWINTKSFANVKSYHLFKGDVLELNSVTHERLQLKKKGVVEISYIHSKKLWRIFPIRSGSVVIKRVGNDGDVKDAFLVQVNNSRENDKKRDFLHKICSIKNLICDRQQHLISGRVNSMELYKKIYRSCQKSIGCQFHLSLSESLYDSFKHDGFYLQDGKSRLLCSIISIEKFKKKYPQLVSTYPPSCQNLKNFQLSIKMELLRNTDKKDIELIDISKMSTQIIAKEFLLETKKQKVELLAEARVVTGIAEKNQLELGLNDDKKSISSTIKLELKEDSFENYSIQTELSLKIPGLSGSKNKIKVSRKLTKDRYVKLAVFTLNRSNSFRRQPLFLANIPLISPFFRELENYTGKSYIRASVMLNDEEF